MGKQSKNEKYKTLSQEKIGRNYYYKEKYPERYGIEG